MVITTESTTKLSAQKKRETQAFALYDQEDFVEMAAL